MQESKETMKEKIRNMYNPVEKRLSLTQKKVFEMLEQINGEIHKLDVEWLQLKALANPSESRPDTELTVAENNTNFDDLSTINALECNFEPIPNVPEQQSQSESEESEMDEDFNIFI